MKKRLLTLVMLALAFVGAKASVVINATNFPDENLRAEVAEFDTDGNGTLSDEEIAEVFHWELHDVENCKGLEYFTSVTELYFGHFWREDYLNITNLDLSPLQNIWSIGFFGCANTSFDVSVCKNVVDVQIADCPNLTSFKAPADVEVFTLTDLPSLTTFDFSIYKKLKACFFDNLGLADIDFSNHPTIERINFSGSEEKLYTLNSINVADCPELYELSFWFVKTESFRLKNLPKFYAFVAENCDCSLISFEDMPVLGTVNCKNSDIRELNIRKCPELTGVSCADNKLRTLIIDDSPMLYSLGCANNQLMWLDMSNVKNLADDEMNWFIADDQRPSAIAYKLSPTEVGLRVHERMDPARMLNLVTNGKSVTAAETFIDGIRYIVFSNEGVNAESLRGKNSTYEYETKWPYPCIGDNTKDNNLPVNLYISSVTKHPSWIKIDGETSISGEMGGTQAAPNVLRSQDYDGKLTWKSSNEDVVKVDAETGAITFVGEGTATITITGAETDYRLAPSAIYLTVIVTESSGISEIVNGKLSNGKYYDLQGRRINGQPVRKGVYVVDGRKIIIN